MSTAEEWVASMLLHNGGYRVDPQRLYDGGLAVRDRKRIDRAELIRRAEGLALQAKRAASTVELEHWAWQRSPGPETLAALEAAQAARTAARDELMAACCYDEALYADLVAWAR